MKSAEFLTKTTSEKEIFTYEDFTHEQVMMYEATKDFINKTIDVTDKIAPVKKIMH